MNTRSVVNQMENPLTKEYESSMSYKFAYTICQCFMHIFQDEMCPANILNQADNHNGVPDRSLSPSKQLQN